MVFLINKILENQAAFRKAQPAMAYADMNMTPTLPRMDMFDEDAEKVAAVAPVQQNTVQATVQVKVEQDPQNTVQQNKQSTVQQKWNTDKEAMARRSSDWHYPFYDTCALAPSDDVDRKLKRYLHHPDLPPATSESIEVDEFQTPQKRTRFAGEMNQVDALHVLPSARLPSHIRRGLAATLGTASSPSTTCTSLSTLGQASLGTASSPSSLSDSLDSLLFDD